MAQVALWIATALTLTSCVTGQLTLTCDMLNFTGPSDVIFLVDAIVSESDFNNVTRLIEEDFIARAISIGKATTDPAEEYNRVVVIIRDAGAPALRRAVDLFTYSNVPECVLFAREGIWETNVIYKRSEDRTGGENTTSANEGNAGQPKTSIIAALKDAGNLFISYPRRSSRFLFVATDLQLPPDQMDDIKQAIENLQVNNTVKVYGIGVGVYNKTTFNDLVSSASENCDVRSVKGWSDFLQKPGSTVVLRKDSPDNYIVVDKPLCCELCSKFPANSSSSCECLAHAHHVQPGHNLTCEAVTGDTCLAAAFGPLWIGLATVHTVFNVGALVVAAVVLVLGIPTCKKYIAARMERQARERAKCAPPSKEQVCCSDTDSLEDPKPERYVQQDDATRPAVPTVKLTAEKYTKTDGATTVTNYEDVALDRSPESPTLPSWRAPMPLPVDNKQTSRRAATAQRNLAGSSPGFNQRDNQHPAGGGTRKNKDDQSLQMETVNNGDDEIYLNHDVVGGRSPNPGFRKLGVAAQSPANSPREHRRPNEPQFEPDTVDAADDEIYENNEVDPAAAVAHARARDPAPRSSRKQPSATKHQGNARKTATLTLQPETTVESEAVHTNNGQALADSKKRINTGSDARKQKERRQIEAAVEEATANEADDMYVNSETIVRELQAEKAKKPQNKRTRKRGTPGQSQNGKKKEEYLASPKQTEGSANDAEEDLYMNSESARKALQGITHSSGPNQTVAASSSPKCQEPSGSAEDHGPADDQEVYVNLEPGTSDAATTNLAVDLKSKLQAFLLLQKK